MNTEARESLHRLRTDTYILYNFLDCLQNEELPEDAKEIITDALTRKNIIYNDIEVIGRALRGETNEKSI